MKCASCDADNDADRRYCGACGDRLTLYCSECSFNNRVSDSFCGGCGRRVGEAQRRTRSAVTLAPLPTEKLEKAEKKVGNEVLSISEVRALMPAQAAPRPAQPLPGKVSQAELDALFGTP